LDAANKYIQTKEPWRPDRNDATNTLQTLYYVLRDATTFYEPVIPNKAAEIFECLKKKEKAIIFPRIIIKEKTL
jgi:methionyl-tRNA synthetase